jgi:RimJ/RimL family protein N-acetyltransferase
MKAIASRLADNLRTERLVLTPPAARHIDELTQLANNSRIHDVMARLPFPYTEADALFYINELAPGPTEHCYAIELHDGRFIGTIGLDFQAGDPAALGYWLGEPFWGQGYMSEAGHELLEAVRATGVIDVLSARVLESNAASIRVLEKLGFTVVQHTESIVERHRAKPLLIMRWSAR